MSSPLTFRPKELTRAGDDEFRIVWEDGHESRYAARRLRQACPCAGCRDEWTGAQMFDPESVAKDLRFADARLVGHYAIQFDFSDGHSTGIYSFEKLRPLCDCGRCR